MEMESVTVWPSITTLGQTKFVRHAITNARRARHQALIAWHAGAIEIRFHHVHVYKDFTMTALLRTVKHVNILVKHARFQLRAHHVIRRLHLEDCQHLHHTVLAWLVIMNQPQAQSSANRVIQLVSRVLEATPIQHVYHANQQPTDSLAVAHVSVRMGFMKLILL